MPDVKINIEATGTDTTNKKIDSVKNQLNTLGSPLKNISDRAKKVSGGFNNLSKSTKDASFSMRHMILRSISLVAVLGAVFAAVNAVQEGFKKAFNAVEQYAKQVAGLTALTITFMKTQRGENLADQYLRARDYAKGLYAVIEDIAAQTLLTGQQATLMARTFLENGVAINTQNQEQIQGLKSIANALAIVTEGQAKERQIRSEINNLLKGQIRPTEALGKLLQNIDPQLKDHLKTWKQQGVLIERVSGLLKGFDATTGDIAVTWEAVSTTISTTVDRVLRGGFKPVYEDILGITKRINKWLTDNADLVELRLLKTYKEIKSVLSDTFGTIRLIYETLKLLRSVSDTIINKLGELGPALSFALRAVSPVGLLTSKISDAADSVKGLRESLEGVSTTGIPKELESLLEPSQIKALIDEGFTSGFLSAEESLDVMAKRIKLGEEGIAKFAKAAKEAGVELNSVQISKMFTDIPELKDVSAKTFGSVAKDIQLIASSAKGGVKALFALSKEGLEKLKIDFKPSDVDTSKFERALDQILVKTAPKFDQIEEKASMQAEDLYKAFLDLPEHQQGQFETRLDQALEAIADNAIRKQEALRNKLQSEQDKITGSIFGLSLSGSEKQEQEIKNKFDSQLRTVQNFFDKVKQSESDPKLIESYRKWVGSQTDILNIEKQKQLEIYRNFTAKIEEFQATGVTLGINRENVSLQKELNTLTGNYEEVILNNIESLKVESQLRQNSLDIAIKEAQKKLADGEGIREELNAQIKLLYKQKGIEEELANIRLMNAEKMKTETGAFTLGLTETINSFKDFNNQVKELGSGTAQALGDSFGTFFFDAMRGDLDSLESYWQNFTQSIFRMLSQILAKWLIVKSLGGIGGGGEGSFGGFITSALGFHKGGLVMHNGGVVPKYHNGGMASDERLAILQTGERVLSRSQNKNFEQGMMNQPPIIVNMTVNATDADSFNNRIMESKDVVANAFMSASANNHPSRRSRV